MRLVKLESVNGSPVWINPEWVIGVHEIPAGIQVMTGESKEEYYLVKGDINKIVSDLTDGDNRP